MNHNQVRQAYGAPVKKDLDRDIEMMIDQVWNELQGRVGRTDIYRVIQVIMPRYENARITTYVPLFVCREAVAMLRVEATETAPDSPIQAPGKPGFDALSDSGADGPLDQNTQLALSASG